jgi:hypothetical protein
MFWASGMIKARIMILEQGILVTCILEGLLWSGSVTKVPVKAVATNNYK